MAWWKKTRDKYALSSGQGKNKAGQRHVHLAYRPVAHGTHRVAEGGRTGFYKLGCGPLTRRTSLVTWCFTPCLPLRLYQGKSYFEKKKKKKKKRKILSGETILSEYTHTHTHRNPHSHTWVYWLCPHPNLLVIHIPELRSCVKVEVAALGSRP